MNYLMKFLWGKTFLFSFLFLLPVCTFSQDIARKSVPEYVGLVNDFSQILTKDEILGLEKKLRAYEDSTSTQIVIVIEKSLNGRDQFNRSMDFARGWKIGQKGKNNGILLYLAIDDRALSFRTTDKTDARLTDIETDRIRRYAMLPYLRNKQYFLALDTGTTAVMQALAGEFKADGKKKKKNKAGGWLFMLAFIGFMILISIFQRKNRHRGYSSTGPIWWGGGFGGWGGGSGSGSGGGWGGMGGGGGFNGGGSDGGW
jgi:uncharacterized protein